MGRQIEKRHVDSDSIVQTNVEVQCCPECGSRRFMCDYHCAEIVCMDCGLVIAAKIVDRGPEWRAFTIEQHEKRGRVGASLTYTIHDKGLSTVIDWHDRDVYGKSLSPGQKAQVYRLRKWNWRVRVSDASERNLAFALSEIAKIASNLNLPKKTLETASVIYRKTLKKQTMRGRPIQGIIAATIYLACRQCKLARTLKEIAQASNIKRKEAFRSYRFLLNDTDYSVPLVSPRQYITKFSQQLESQGKVEEIAHKILTASGELKISCGRGPTGMAAAAIYIASVLTGERRTQSEIAEIAQITEVTIRNRYKELGECLTFQISL